MESYDKRNEESKPGLIGYQSKASFFAGSGPFVLLALVY